MPPLPDAPVDETEVVFSSLRQAGFLRQSKPVSERAIRNLTWVKDGISASEKDAVQELIYLAVWYGHAFHALMEQARLDDGDGIDEAKVGVTLRRVMNINPDLLDTLLDTERVTPEERTIELPLAGEVQLTIIRTRPGAERTMDLLESAVRTTEEFMSAPFPKRQVTYLFEEAVTESFDGAHFGSHIVSLPKFDDAGSSVEWVRRHITHEVAHYYWTGSETWLNEGGAELLGAIADSTAAGKPVYQDRFPCPYVKSLAELERLSPEKGSQEFDCYYSLGARLFQDLYRNLDEVTFRLWFRNLYLKSQVEDSTDRCLGTRADICHVRSAFTDEEISTEVLATIDKVIARWHDGSEPYDTSFLDTGPVNSVLPDEVNGYLTRAYIALDKDRREETTTDKFSASQVQDWVSLYLHFSYDKRQEPYELAFTVVEYFEDGLAFRLQDRTTTFKTGWSHSWQRFWIGVNPKWKWAPGHYWVYIYHEGRKIAEVEYEVTP